MNFNNHTKYYSPNTQGLSGAIGEANKMLAEQGFAHLQNMREVYFIGIGGIGMSAIARFFQLKGVKVSGYDKTETPLTIELVASGIAIHYQENLELIPKNPDAVIYTPAIPKEHKELVYYLQHNHQVIKRSDVLQTITQHSFNICIAGTHGKTTITSMVAHLLRDAGFGCNAFLGGIAVNYATNFWSNERNVCVVEADEYDRSFLKLNPDIALVTSMDADHLDIYGTAAAMEQAFVSFAQKTKPGGIVIGKFGLAKLKELKGINCFSYSLQNDSAAIYADNIKIEDGGYLFDVMLNGKQIREIRLNMGGMHNVENAVAAIAVASALGIDDDKIKNTVESYKGVKRRFEYIEKRKDLVYIDDYAHHPEELRALITGAKTLYPQRKCTIIFQPHLYSRTNDHAAGFAEVLSLADEIILLPIYPARELPMKGVSSEMIIEKMNTAHKSVMQKQELLDWVENHFANNINKDFGELLITAGAGDIDALVEPIKKIMNR